MNKIFLTIALLSFKVTIAADCTPQYSQAVQTINQNPKRAIQLFQAIITRGEVECGDLLVGRSYLQSALTYRMKLMEPWLALDMIKQFLAKPYAATHPSFPWANENHTLLMNYKNKIDEYQARFEAEPNIDKKIEIKIEMGHYYLSPIDAPRFAYLQFEQGYVLSGNTCDTCYYLMAHSFLALDNFKDSLRLFNDFLIKFPKSVHRLSAFSWAFEIEFQNVKAERNSGRRQYLTQKLIKRIDESFIEFPTMDKKLKAKFEWYKKELGV